MWTVGPVLAGDSIRITGMAESSSGEVWISDGNAGRVIVLTSDGHFVRFVGERSEERGGFQAPRLIAVMNDREMGVLDVGRSTVEVFTTNGRWLRQIPLALQLHYPKGFVVRDNEIMVSGGTYSKDEAIHAFDMSGRWLRSWGGFPEPTDRTMKGRENAMNVAGGPLAMDGDGNVIYSQAAPHRIVRYVAGNPADSTTIAGDDEIVGNIVDEFKNEVERDGKTVTTFRWFFDQSRGVVPFGGRYVLNSITFEDQSRTLWQIYDSRTGELLSGGTTSGHYWLWGVTSDGDLLATLWQPEMRGSSAVRLKLAWSE